MENKDLYFFAELKELEEDGIFEGYASTFGNIDQVGDIIERGAFEESLKMREPKVLWQHEMDKPVGKVMVAKEDDRGLYVKVKIAKMTSIGKDAYEYIKAGVIDKLSIGFRVKECDYETRGDERVRVIKALELFEFSLVTIPANEKAELVGYKNEPFTQRDVERYLRAGGFSRTAAKAICAKGYKGYEDVLRDADINIPSDDLREADGLKEISNSLAKLNKTLQEYKLCQTLTKLKI